MAKKYTRAQWQRIQAKLPEDERVPYEQSPDVEPQVEGQRGGDSRAAAQTYAPAQGVTDTSATRDSTAAGQTYALSGINPDLRTSDLKTQREEKYYGTQKAAQGEKPTPPADDEQYTYDYVWRTDVGGGGTGKWVLVRFPKAGAGAGTGGAGGTGGGVGGGAGAGGSSGPSGQDVITYTASDGTKFTDQAAYATYQASLNTQAATNLANQQQASALAAQQTAARQSAYDLLYSEFNQYGLGALVTPLKSLIQSGISPSEFTLRLRETDAYKKRFAANAQRIAKGLTALNESTYIKLEDAYQNVMRNYGLPESYYARGELGAQPGFEKFIANDVSAPELEDRIQTAYNRVINAAPEVTQALKQFYPDITRGDILAYALDPQQALINIKRKVTAAEIGGAALQAGLEATQGRAEQLMQYGVTGAQAQQDYQKIGGGLQRGSELASIYNQTPYTQTTAEQEVFGTPGAAQAQQQRKKLISTERATFGGTTGAGGALARERAGAY